MARNRIIYASQSVWVNGEVLYRVQSLGTTTTFTSEDIFQLGQLDIVDVVDEVPAVAVTLNTNDFGDVMTLAILAQIAPAKRTMSEDADTTNANLISGSTYLHGIALADFAVICGNLPGVTLWAPVQSECDLGTLANNIDQTLFLDEVYVNSLEFSYTTGANATENYGAETDNKMWLLNDGKFVNYDSFTVSGTGTYVDLTLEVANEVADLSAGIGFLRKSTDGSPAVSLYDMSENEMVNVKIVESLTETAATDHYVYYEGATYHRVLFPTGALKPGDDDRLEIIYSADGYGTGVSNKYFEALSDSDRPEELGAVRQGQVEIYISDSGALENAWRLTGCTISADLTREPLAELGHLGPYDRPLTLPIPITVTVDSTAGDLENWAKFSGKDKDTDAQLTLADLMGKDDLSLVVKIFEQTDEEAGGTGGNRKILAAGGTYFLDGDMDTYTSIGDTEYALKTIIVKNLKITDEGATLDMGANMTQTFGFRSTNDLYVIKGDIDAVTPESVVRRS